MKIRAKETHPTGAGGAKAVVVRLARFWWIVVVSALIVGGCALAASAIQTPIYASTATVYVTSGADADTQSAYQGSLASQQRVASYVELVQSNAIVGDALGQSQLAMSIEEAREAVEATTKPDTVLLQISATSPDAAVAATLANAVAQSLSRFVSTLEQPSGGGDALAKVTVVTPAVESATPVEPKPVRNGLLGLGVGLMLGLLIVILKVRFDNRIRVSGDIEGLGGLTVIGDVPTEESLKSAGVVDFGGGSNPAAEAYRRLRTNLSFANVDDPIRKILVTSPNQGEGKTTTAINLAVSLAEAGSKVVLVDGDLRKPALASRLGCSQEVGFTDYLRGEATMADLVQPSGISRLDVLASGQLPPNSAELLGSQRARLAIAELQNHYDFVVVDSPPVLPVTDAAVLSQWVDGTLLIVRSGRTRSRELASAIDEVSAGQTPVVGVVLNDVRARHLTYSYSYYGTEASADVVRRPKATVTSP